MTPSTWSSVSASRDPKPSSMKSVSVSTPPASAGQPLAPGRQRIASRHRLSLGLAGQRQLGRGIARGGLHLRVLFRIQARQVRCRGQQRGERPSPRLHSVAQR
jgi:hypothetical protein